MADQAHIWTDEQIARLEYNLQNHYVEATAEMMQKQERFMQLYDREKGRLDDKLRTMKINKTEYKRQMAEYTMKKEWFEGMIDSLAESAVTADRHAMEMINNEIPGIYTENYNFAGYQVESGLNINTNFTLMDEDTLRNLLIKDPDLLPRWEIDEAKDMAWNKQKFNSAITQSLLQGESIPDMTARIQNVMGMDERAACRTARTAATSAENAGRMQSYERMRENGIVVRKEWLATLDHRTRSSHRLEDGTVVDLKDEFPHTGLQFPGDPDGDDPGEIYNCRCTLVPSFEQVDTTEASRYDDLGSMSYDEWKEGKF